MRYDVQTKVKLGETFKLDLSAGLGMDLVLTLTTPSGSVFTVPIAKGGEVTVKAGGDVGVVGIDVGIFKPDEPTGGGLRLVRAASSASKGGCNV